jgi:hypothetical protein
LSARIETKGRPWKVHGARNGGSDTIEKYRAMKTLRTTRRRSHQQAMQRLEGQEGAGSINGMSKLVVLTMKKFC